MLVKVGDLLLLTEADLQRLTEMVGSLNAD